MIFLTIPYVCFLCVDFSTAQDANEIPNDIRPYEFAFNVVDFQHRFEKKDEDGIVTGEYGFITADGVYHETGYATDKDGDFIITKMRNRKLRSQKDIEEFFKDKPEVAKKLMAAIERSCSDCNNLINTDKIEDEGILNGTAGKYEFNTALNQTKNSPKKLEKPVILTNLNEIQEVRKGKSINRVESSLANDVNLQNKNENREENSTNEENSPGENSTISNLIEKMGNDLHYRFNYSIPSHGHNEKGYRNGRKDGNYHSKGEDGVDVKVEYLSNEFGHQPNITIIPGPALNSDEEALKGYSFVWYRK